MQLSEREGLELWRRAVTASVRSDAPDLTARQQAILMTIALTPGPHTVRGLAANSPYQLMLRGRTDLGVGGWSYGGILTNYVITQTDRFKAAVSGASEVNYTANYGHDIYQREWEIELGLPWENQEGWDAISPFWDAPKVTTPTQFMVGQEDWNVPAMNSEQFYLALKRLGIDTKLVVYPGEDHSIDRPSFVDDRYQRFIDWYDTYLKP